MYEYSNYHTFKVILDQVIKDAQEYRSSSREKLKKLEKNGKLAEKLKEKSSFKRYDKKVSELSELIKLINKVSTISSTVRQANFDSSKMYETLEQLASYLPEDELRLINGEINSIIHTYYREQSEKISDHFKLINKQIKSMKLEGKKPHYDIREAGLRTYISKTYKEWSDIIEAEELSKLSEKNTTKQIIKPKNVEGKYPDREIERLERFLNSGKYDKNNKELVTVLMHLSEIKQAREKVVEITEINKYLGELSHILPKDKKSKKLTSIIDKLISKYEKELKKSLVLLEKYDIKKALEAEKAYQEAKDKEDQKRFQYNSYKNASYELEKAKAEEPENTGKIRKLEQELYQIGMSASLLTEGEKLDALAEGSDKYKSEVREREAFIEARKESEEREREMAASRQERLRQEALAYLEAHHAFDDMNVEKNGDVYTDHEAIERMIQNTIEQLENGTLYETQEQELTPEQNYIRYRAGLKDKSQAMFYREYLLVCYPKEEEKEEEVAAVEEVEGMKL